MQMGPKEIARDYRTAANKQKQIKVLAELNQCAERRIAEILDAEGEELPKKWQEQLQKPTRRSWKFPEEPEAPETELPEAPEDLSPAPMAAEESREEDPSTPAAPPLRMTGRAEAVLRASLTAGTKEDQIKALAELNQCSEQRIAEILADEGFESVAVPAPEKTATVTLDPTVWDRGALERKIEPEPEEAAEVTPEPEPETLRPEATGAGDVIHGEVCEASLITREDVCLGACENLLAALDLKPDEFHCYACGTLDLVFSLIGVPKVWQPIHDRRV